MQDTITRIKELAKNKGISQAWLCGQLGVRRTYLSEVERGKDKLTGARLQQIAVLLGTTEDFLVTGHPDKKEKPTGAEADGLNLREDEAEVIRRWRELSPSQQLLVRRALGLPEDASSVQPK